MKNFNIKLPNGEEYGVKISEDTGRTLVYKNNFANKIRKIFTGRIKGTNNIEEKIFFEDSKENTIKLQKENYFLQQELDKKNLEDSKQKEKIKNLNQEIEKLMKQIDYFYNNYKESFEESQELKLQIKKLEYENEVLKENKKLETNYYKRGVFFGTILKKYNLTIVEAEEILKNHPKEEDQKEEVQEK